MLVIGLCGGSGSGKGEVSRIFSERGFPIIDTDGIYRELTAGDSECLRALALEFGGDIISPDGSLDRRRLASLVFSGEGALRRLSRLNEISHSFILDETRKRLLALKEAGVPAAIVDAPVLFESGFDKEREAAEERIDSQMSDDRLSALCDYTLCNNSSLDELRSAVSRVADDILKNQE